MEIIRHIILYQRHLLTIEIFLILFMASCLASSEPNTQAEVIFEAAFQGECRSNGPCQHLCFDLHDGTFECACKTGFTLADNGYSCIENRLLDEQTLSINGSLEVSHGSTLHAGSSGRPAKRGKAKKYFNFNSCSQIECEAGGICVEEEPMHLPITTHLKTGRIKHMHRKLHCRCPLGRGGFFCEKPMEVTVPRFTGKSYLALPTLRGAENRMHVQLELRITSSEGLLLYTGEEQSLQGSHFSVSLHDGHVQFAFDCGGGLTTLTSKYPLPLHSWIRVNVSRVENFVAMQIDAQPPVSTFALGPCVAMQNRLELFLGGSPNTSLVAPRVRTSQGFSGCVRHLQINRKRYDLRGDSHGDAIDGVGIEECEEDSCSRTSCANGALCSVKAGQSPICLCPNGFFGSNCELEASLMPHFDGNSFVQLPGIEQNALSFLELDILFKTQSDSGVLLFNGDAKDGDFILIYLQKSYVYFTFNLGNGPATVRTASKVHLDKWHHVHISRTTKIALIALDDQPHNHTTSSGAYSQLSLSRSLWLGGLAVGVYPEHEHRTSIFANQYAKLKGGFRGCVQRLRVNGHLVDLHRRTLLSANVRPCAHACSQKPCQNGAQCVPSMDHFRCNCTANFKGTHCETEEMVSIPMFYGNSYLHYMEPQILAHINNNKLDLKLRFRAFSPNGLLLWAGSIGSTVQRARAEQLAASSSTGEEEQLDNDLRAEVTELADQPEQPGEQSTPAGSFMWLALNEGRLEYEHQLHKSLLPLRMVFNNISRLDDGKWHELHLQRRRNEVLLQVDTAPQLRAKLSVEEQQLGSLVSNKGLYLGGLEDASWRTGNRYSGGIIGCIAHVHLSLRVKISLVVQASSAVNIRPCI